MRDNASGLYPSRPTGRWIFWRLSDYLLVYLTLDGSDGMEELELGNGIVKNYNYSKQLTRITAFCVLRFVRLWIDPIAISHVMVHRRVSFLVFDFR